MAQAGRIFGPPAVARRGQARLGRWSRTVLNGARGGRSVGEVRWQELTKQECFELLAGQHLGRVVLVDDLGPIALPVNYLLDRHSVLFRTDEGTKLDVASRGAR